MVVGGAMGICGSDGGLLGVVGLWWFSLFKSRVVVGLVVAVGGGWLWQWVAVIGLD